MSSTGGNGGMNGIDLGYDCIDGVLFEQGLVTLIPSTHGQAHIKGRTIEWSRAEEFMRRYKTYGCNLEIPHP